MEKPRSTTAVKPRQPRRKRTQPPPPSRASGGVSEGVLSQAFLELAPDAMLVADAAGHILQANHQTEVLFGYPRAALLGRTVELLVPDRFLPVHQQHRADYAAEPHTRPMGMGLELFGRRQDGSEFPVEVSLSPFQLGEDLLVICSVRDITARKRLEQERAEAAERLLLQAQLIDHAHDAILVRASEGHILSWNQGAETLYGWSEREVLGQVTHTLLQTHFPESLPAMETQFARDGQWEGELEHTARDGRVVVVESRQVYVRNGQGQRIVILEVNRNITERKRLEAAEHAAHRAAEQQRALLQRVLDELPGGAYLVRGNDARLVIANHAAQVTWGARWWPGQSMAAFLQASGVRYFTENGQPLSLDELVTMQMVRGKEPQPLHEQQRREVIRRPDGTRLPILLTAVLIDATLLDEAAGNSGGKEAVASTSDESAAALVLLQDISAIQATEQLKDEFVSMAAHELRTPLAVIQGYADMLSVQTARGHGPELADWQQEAIAEIESATMRLNALVQDLLEATRIQAGRLALHPVALELVALVRRCLTRLQLSTTQHTLTLEAPNDLVLLAADGLRLEQVLGNLVGNAIKYSPDGGPITVTVLVDAAAGQAQVRVRDHGIGIPADEQAQLFQRFARASNVHDHHIPGSGLGLYICRELVERHGGHLWFESHEGEGTTFTLTLPMLDPADVAGVGALEATSPEESLTAESQSHATGGLRVDGRSRLAAPLEAPPEPFAPPAPPEVPVHRLPA